MNERIFGTLLGHEVLPVEGANWELPDISQRRVGRTELQGGITVSTVFLGVDHGINSDHPLWFETMVFGDDGRLEDWTERYATWEEAEAGHARVVWEVSGILAVQEARAYVLAMKEARAAALHAHTPASPSSAPGGHPADAGTSGTSPCT